MIVDLYIRVSTDDQAERGYSRRDQEERLRKYSKVMLAIYLATPEVENDRRALNTFYGMRRAKKEGRMMGTAPFGYLNRCTKDGKKYVALNEHQAKHWKWAFEEIAKNQLAPEQIRREMNKIGGFKMSTSAFHAGIRNPIYCGKIFIE